MHFRYFINLIIPHEPTFFYFLSSVRNSKGLLSIKFLCVTLPHMSIPSRNPAHSFQKSRAFLSGILRIPFRNPLEIHVCCSLLPESVLYWVQRRNGWRRPGNSLAGHGRGPHFAALYAAKPGFFKVSGRILSPRRRAGRAGSDYPLSIRAAGLFPPAPGRGPGCRPGRGPHRRPGPRFVFLPPHPAVGAGEELRARGRADA